MQPVEAIKQRIFGRLFDDGVLWAAGRMKAGEPEWFSPVPAEAPEPTLYYVRYALTLRGTERPILPVSMLDDWGNEMGKLKLYKWLRDEGDLYPRSEIFGFDLLGNETQNFVREFELYDKYPCYVYSDPHDPIKSGQRINSIVVLDENSAETGKIKPPVHIPQPLRRTQVTWFNLQTSSAQSLLNSSYFS